MDVRQYFASISHRRLATLLRRKIKGHGVLSLIERIVAASGTGPGRGLPIGALTSQHFANFYLHDLDRGILEHPACRGYVRYMDDFVVWADSVSDVHELCEEATKTLGTQLGLELKRPAIIQKADEGLTFCGFRIFPGTIRLAFSRRKRLKARLRYWESRFEAGDISESDLQCVFDSLAGIMQHIDGNAWLKALIGRHSLVARENAW